MDLYFQYFQATLLSSIGWEGPDSFLVPEQVFFLLRFELEAKCLREGELQHLLVQIREGEN